MPPQQDRTRDALPKQAVLYLRVSSRGQVDTDYDPEGISLPAQREACRRRAAELGADVIGEYVEAGRSGTTVEGRPEFQKMMARIKAERDVDYVIVYARSRMHRNTIDAAITKRDLRSAGAVLVSVMDYTEDSAIGDLVATVLDGVNEYQSRASGADISYKMAQKVARGGSVGMAPLGYLNIREKFEGREVRTVIVDPEAYAKARKKSNPVIARSVSSNFAIGGR
jgi:site-specific DNA recombinase